MIEHARDLWTPDARGAIRSFATAITLAALLAACGGSGARPEAAPVASTAPTSSTTTTVPLIAYRVKSGDTLTAISRQFRISVATLVARNHLADPDRLVAGQTLSIPPAPPLKLKVNPAGGRPGQAFRLTLTGAAPLETITFEVDSATSAFTGGPHTASPTGAVTATYQSSPDAPTGIYSVTARGNFGSTARAGFLMISG